MLNIVFAFVYLLNILGLGVNIFINPVFLRNLNLDPTYFLLVFAIAGAMVLFRKKDLIQENIVKRLFSINKYIVLPFSFLAIIIFTVVELTYFPNYVFSNLGIYYFDFIYIFILSYFTYLFGLGKNALVRNFKKHILILSLVLIFIFAVIFTLPNDLYVFISSEDGILENFQFLFYFLAGITALFSVPLVHKSKLFPSIIYFVLGIALIFIAFEEISWGQRITGYSIPFLQDSNYKMETNIHNQSFIGHFLLQLGYVIVGFYGSFSYLVLKRLKNFVNLISPSQEFFIYYFILFLVYIYVIPAHRIYQEEVAETMLSLGTMLFLIRNFFLLKASLIRG